jgi:YidC/Oxa1 family membrane protein insertase
LPLRFQRPEAATIHARARRERGLGAAAGDRSGHRHQRAPHADAARGSYVLELQDAIGNTGAGPQQVYPFVRLSRIAPPAPPKHSFATNPDSFSFVGSAWYTGSSFDKTPYSKYAKESPPSDWVQGAWISMLQHHFLAAWVPTASEQQLLQTGIATQDGHPLFQIRSTAPALALAPGASATHESKLWVGPKLQAPMNQVAPKLSLAVDYGVLSFISRPLFWLLAQLHKLIGNWGWAIIAIVIVLKALLYWPSKKQYQSMAKMRAVMPRIEALKERYGDDKQALNVAMFELYKKEKVNPAAGCWPILVQMPIFLGLYWVLIETVELRQQPWMGWIQNLTAPDPYFVLPALNLAVMYLTQRMTPTPGMDPMQRKMMQVMPLVFGLMMAFFPAGLVLYWVTNGSLGLLQQWWMLRRYGQKPAAGTAVAR